MRRHAIDPFSLIFGATFTALGLIFLLTNSDLTSLHLQWIWPVPIIALGVTIIALAARGRRHDAPEEPEESPL